MITEERFTYNFQHFMTSYERLENGMVAASKQFVRLGLLEMQERDGSGTVTAENAWRPGAPGGLGGLLVRKSGEQKYTSMTNHLGHVYGVFDKTGNRVDSHSYSAYGYASGDDFSLQPFGMSTKRSDFACGLVYFGYRFYVPNLGRWLNRDPLQEQGGINLYAYVQGDPLGYVDPDGRFAVVLHPAILIPVSAYLVCRALGGCIIPDNLFNSWHRNESAESEGDSSDVPVNCPIDESSHDSKLRKSDHAKLRSLQGRGTSQAHSDLQNARDSDIFVQDDGRFVVRGARGREHIIERDGELVTTVNGRSNKAHQSKVGKFQFRPTQEELEKVRSFL